ncbi:transposable element Tcb1 transposase [Trichonephila clavipes]|nr:transposable element Tcb1 transposase [Trichonephila clavipes]
MAVNDRTASSRQLAARWSTTTGVLMSASSIHRRLPNHQRQRLRWAHKHRAWQADRHQVVFSDESCFSLWYHDSRIRVRRYAGERCLSECVIERHSGPTPGVMIWGVRFRIMDDPICYELRVISRTTRVHP